MAAHNIFSHSPEENIQRLYEYTLHRPATGQEVLDALEMRTAGSSYESIFNALLSSDEMTGVVFRVVRLYEGVFGRKPDHGGLTYWSDVYRHVLESNPLETDKNNLITSIQDWLDPTRTDEFAERYGTNPTDLEFTTNLYRNILGREPDPGGLNYWVGQLAVLTREQLVIEFTESVEFISRSNDAIVQFAYNGFLGAEDFEGSLLPPNPSPAEGQLVIAVDQPGMGQELATLVGDELVPVGNIQPGTDSGQAGEFGFAMLDGGFYTYAETGAATYLAEFLGKSFDPVTPGAGLPAIYTPGTLYGYIEYEGTLYFVGYNGVTGPELYSYDGSTMELVGEIAPGPAAGMQTDYEIRGLSGFVEFQGAVYFEGVTGTHGKELYRFDGNTIERVTDINPGTGSANIGAYSGYILYDNKLFFSADDGSSGRELWSFDGQTATMVADIDAGPGNGLPNEDGILTTHDGYLFFTAHDPVNGLELRRYDGTDIVTYDLEPGAAGAFDNIEQAWGDYAGDLYFSARTASTGAELFRYSNGTVELVSDIEPNSPDSFAGKPTGFAVLDDILYFSAYRPVTGYEIYQYNGSVASLAFDISPGASWSTSSTSIFEVVDGRLIFDAWEDGYTKLFAYDGTNLTNIGLFGNVNGSVESSNPVAYDGMTLVGIATPALGYEPYLMTPGGLQLIGDFIPGTGSSRPFTYGHAVYDGDLYFGMEGSGVGYELYRYDGTDVTLVENIRSGGADPNVGFGSGFANHDGKLFFSAISTSSGYELFSYDGTSVEMVFEQTPDTTGAAPGRNTGLISLGDKLIFDLDIDGLGNELYAYDGTDVELVADINAGSGDAFAFNGFQYAILDGLLIFGATDETGDSELWTYDGTDVEQFDIYATGSSRAGQNGFFTFEDRILFSARTDFGQEVVVFDGTSLEVIDVFAGGGSSNLFSGGAIEYGGKLYFSGRVDTASNFELLVYDGTNVTVAADINSGSGSSDAGENSGFVEFGGKIYFSAFTEETGAELYAFDGQEAELVADILKGDGSSGPSDLFVQGGYLYFKATTRELGSEWYAYDGTDIGLVADMGQQDLMFNADEHHIL
ncbi:MAG: DUF4214 domain-containing protein [Zhengella sp.]|uniref:DUF4214 domain-containing protein n=1 Tax=Zhengella sp. TaxID=2282762 RepID=UPI003527322A